MFVDDGLRAGIACGCIEWRRSYRVQQRKERWWRTDETRQRRYWTTARALGLSLAESSLDAVRFDGASQPEGRSPKE